MVSRHMVLFGITHLRLDIFITWWMNIFQSTVVWRHFASLLIRHCILGHTPSPRALDLPQVSFTFWSSCWLPWVAYWGIPSFSEIIGPFTGFIIFRPSCQSSCVVILGYVPSIRVCLHYYLSHPWVLGHLIMSFIILLVQLEFGAAPISIGHVHHLPVMLVFESGQHLYRSAISLSCQFRVGTAPISIDHLPVMSVCVWVGAAPISIRHLPIMSVFESGPHLYRSVIVLSVRVWGRTYIDRKSVV